MNWAERATARSALKTVLGIPVVCAIKQRHSLYPFRQTNVR